MIAIVESFTAEQVSPYEYVTENAASLSCDYGNNPADVALTVWFPTVGPTVFVFDRALIEAGGDGPVHVGGCRLVPGAGPQGSMVSLTLPNLAGERIFVPADAMARFRDRLFAADLDCFLAEELS